MLDFIPECVGAGHENLALFTAGWGMKMVPLIGEILAQLVIDGKTLYDISHYKITLSGVLSPSPVVQTQLVRMGSDTH